MYIYIDYMDMQIQMGWDEMGWDEMRFMHRQTDRQADRQMDRHIDSKTYTQESDWIQVGQHRLDDAVQIDSKKHVAASKLHSGKVS